MLILIHVHYRNSWMAVPHGFLVASWNTCNTCFCNEGDYKTVVESWKFCIIESVRTSDRNIALGVL